MESFSRPFHGNQASSATFSKKLSTANSFSAGKAYDVVFAGAPKFGGPTYSSRIEDYNEIFGSSQASRASAVPILDLSAPGEAEVLADVQSSKVDYSSIFGGFREDIAVSFEEMFAKPKGAKNLSDDTRTTAKTASPSDGSDRLNCNKEETFSYEAPNQSTEGMKQFNTSYHKTSQRSNDRTNGTTHVAQLLAVPGFTCFIDENPALQKTKLDKSEHQTEVDANLTKKQTSDGLGKFKSQSSGDKFCSNGESFYANENNPKRHASKMSSSSSLPANLVSNKSEPKRSMASSFEVPKSDASKSGPGECSPSFSDEEVDVNSAAAASAAALRKALEKAQASIKIAKEFMERKKDGTRRFSKPSSKDGSDVKKRREVKATVEGNGIREKNAKKICESADVVLQVFARSEREKARRSGKVAPNNNESQETSISKEVVGETNGNSLESAEDCQALRRFSELVNTGEHRTATLAGGHADDRNNIMRSVDAPECGTAEEILEQLYENGKKLDEGAHELEAMEGKLNVVKMTREWEQHVDRLDTAQEVPKHEEDEKVGVDQEDEETEEKQKVSSGQEKCEKKWVESLEPEENEEVFVSQDARENNNDGLDESQDCMENEKKCEDVFGKEQNKKLLKDVHKEERENRLKKICEQDEIEKRLQAAWEWVDYEEDCEVESNQKRENDAHKGDDNEKRLDKIQELDIYNKRLNGTPDGEESEERQEDDSDRKGKERILMEAYEFEETEGTHRQTTGNETTEVNHQAVKQTINLDPVSDACKWDEGESRSESQEAHRHKENVDGMNIKKNERISDVTQSSCEFKQDEKEFKAVGVVHELGKEEMCKTGGLVGGAVEHIETQNKVKCATEALLSKDNPANIDVTGTNSGPRQTDKKEESELASNVGSRIKLSVCESGEKEKKSEDKIAFDLEEVKSNSDTAHEKSQSVEMRKEMEASQPCSVFKREEKTTGIDEVTKKGRITEKNEEDLHKSFAVEQKETKETGQKEVKADNERLSKNDEANKRERQREKDRMAVGRAVREARERAFAEAQERAERAAVERATAEARERVIAEAREKFEKSSAATKSSSEKASIETKLRAERAAVERATTEARERALEKALSQKATSGSKGQAERFVAEKFSGVSRDRRNFPSSDKQRLDGTIGESAQRSKARLERHQRTMERAAKALAEKNRRDLLAQKEQAERNRLAETLDAEVKRWSSGKTGNLRALLSTLQYILGRDSGWQPISLTDIITTDAVKKAYRKATLHVHPDKLQQRGASIQQKYICEKVFDLLKAAWNKFNSEER